MNRLHLTPNFRGWTAIVLHRPHAAADAVLRQLERLGIAAHRVWSELGPEDVRANVVFFDADMGYDGQFPWPAGQAPMPLIALLGSEAPGRVQWALSQGADAHLLKPIGSGGVFSSLVIAERSYHARERLTREVEDLKGRLARRPQVARAMVMLMMSEQIDETAAFRRLREIAMASRRTIEDAAQTFIENRNHPDVSRHRA